MKPSFATEEEVKNIGAFPHSLSASLYRKQLSPSPCLTMLIFLPCFPFLLLNLLFKTTSHFHAPREVFPSVTVSNTSTIIIFSNSTYIIYDYLLFFLF